MDRGHPGGFDGPRGGYRQGNNGLRGGSGYGIIIGYYGGHPYYCRNHRHWRWSNRMQRYVYSNRGGWC